MHQLDEVAAAAAAEREREQQVRVGRVSLRAGRRRRDSDAIVADTAALRRLPSSPPLTAADVLRHGSLLSEEDSLAARRHLVKVGPYIVFIDIYIFRSRLSAVY